MKAHLQTQFTQFHEAIKLNNMDENALLREKRDILLGELRDSDNIPAFDPINQGSYAMGTGIKPVDGDYDIDIGVHLHIDHLEEDPVHVKSLIADELERKKRKVEWKRPCIRVQYKKGDEPLYHVDLAIYGGSDSKGGGDKYLARGYKGSTAPNKNWQPADPEELKVVIQNHLDDAQDREQFRRCIRYLKRWKDIHFKSTGDAAPTGIAITALALKYFQPNKEEDYTANKVYYNDLRALRDFVNGILNSFTWLVDISIKLPVTPFNDLFEKMSDNQKADLKIKLKKLNEVLDGAINGIDPHEDAKNIQEFLGGDFPVPNKKDTAQNRPKPFITSSHSA